MKFKIFVVLLCLSTLIHADIFEQNSLSLGAKYSRASNQGKNYDVVGVHANYFVFDGLGVGVEYENWMNDKPRVEKIGVSATYFIPVTKPIRPYVGGVYKRMFVDSVYDRDTYGYRAGISFSSDFAMMALGWSEERLSSCQDNQPCSNGYAEVMISIGFAL